MAVFKVSAVYYNVLRILRIAVDRISGRAAVEVVLAAVYGDLRPVIGAEERYLAAVQVPASAVDGELGV